MKITTARVVLVGLVLIIAGASLGFQGDLQQSRASVTIEMSSASTYGDILGFEPTGEVDEDMAQAREDLASGQAKSLLGWTVALFGVATLLVGAPLAHRSKNRSRTMQQAASSAGGAPAGLSQVSVRRRPCPDCGELIAEAARKCRYCGLHLT